MRAPVVVRDYIEVLKPRESGLLAFIGVCAAIVAGDGRLSLELLPIALTILVASAGANGLTNYLDRHVDARMRRTRNRVLPSRRIFPPEKVLPMNIILVTAGLALAWQWHWLVFVSDLAGTIAAVTWRKKATCVFPQGVVAGCAPVLMGWFAVRPEFGWELLLLCLLIVAWLPLHVWSVMISNREDYLGAGLGFFPLNWKIKDAVKVLLVFSLVLYAASMALYFIGGFAWLYLGLANVLGALVIYASARLVITGASRDAWRLYKLSAFPYLGVLFLTMYLDPWLTI
ncbi:MAG: UbiA family prenyltransferase [Chloroflexi bacterium]|nr:UbiA family prenyltransferase [Chloroflexota bacterium]